jgi:hypothetical protein
MPRASEYDSSEGDSEDESSSIIDMCTQMPPGEEIGVREASDSEDDDEDDWVSHMAMSSGRNSRGVLWENGSTIRMRFQGGSSSVREKVEEYAKIWEKYANITFRFTDNRPSHIRISFYRDRGWNSFIGKGALAVPEPRPTMNLAATSRTPSRALKRHVLHEFGHALGCIHEHSSPAAKIPWNLKAVYAYYRKQGWNSKKVKHNVLRTYDRKTVTQFSRFDPNSIMIYPISRRLTLRGFSIPWNTTLSETDKRFIARMYPGRN